LALWNLKPPGYVHRDTTGYNKVKLSDNKWEWEHRLVVQSVLGRPLSHGEEVHHLNGVRCDNRPENLVVVPSKGAHRLLERRANHYRRAVRLPGEPNPVVPCACGCGSMILRYDKNNRVKRYAPNHNGRWVGLPPRHSSPEP